MSVVTPAVAVAEPGALLPDVDVVQRPLVLFTVVVLDPPEARGAGPAGGKANQIKGQLNAKQSTRYQTMTGDSEQL